MEGDSLKKPTTISDKMRNYVVNYSLYRCAIVSTLVLTVLLLAGSIALLIAAGSAKKLAEHPSGWTRSKIIPLEGIDLALVKTESMCILIKKEGWATVAFARPMTVSDTPLDSDTLQRLIGDYSEVHCTAKPVFMASDYGRSGKLEKRRDPREAVYNEAVNDNRCKKKMVVCEDSIGQTNGCHTGINGIFWLDVTCTSATEFKVQMTKPPGRLLKLVQENFYLCQERKRQGLEC